MTDADHERRCLAFFTNPSSYPHPVETIAHRQTHVSHVFLAGDFAYKLKKTVRFPFLDASTLALRRKWYRLEIALNRRLAPDIYLGVTPVVETAQGWRLGGKGTVVESVVRMRRLPERRMLDQLVRRGEVGSRDMAHIAQMLIRFFARAARSRRIDRYGSPERVAELVLGNLRECRPFVGTLLSERDRAVLEAAYRQFLTLRKPILLRRVREGRIIDGHGDLRCENICLTDPVTIFDCVEFQPAFRCGDLVNDFSFLVMDLEFRGRDDLARVLVDRYRAAIHDPTFDVVLPFYECHRSLVRGKVRALAWRQHPTSAEGRRLRELSRRHFALAVRYARRFAPPRLVVVGGLIGTGKSTVARSLAEALGAAWLRTDEIRLGEFGRYRRGGGGFAAGLYAPRVSALVYRRLIQRARALIHRGGCVVCDGTFSKALGREALRRLAARHRASFHFIECVAPRAVALRRVARRAQAGADLSEARPEHYDRLRAGFESARPWRASYWTRLSTAPSRKRVHAAVLTALRGAWRL